MKKFIGGLIVGLLVASTSSYVLCSYRTGILKMGVMSAIDTPVRLSMDEIVVSYDNGQSDLAEAQVRFLQHRWGQYIEMNTPPYGLSDVHIDIGKIQVDGKPD